MISAEEQVRQVRRVIAELKKSEGSIHGPVIDEVRRSTGEWLEHALDGLLDPDDARVSYPLPQVRCWSLGCKKRGRVKSEQWGGYLCAAHALSGPEESS